MILSGLTVWFVIKFILTFAFLNLLSFIISSILVQKIVNNLKDDDKTEILLFFKELNKHTRKHITNTERKISPLLMFFPCYALFLNSISVVLSYSNQTKNGIVNAIYVSSQFRICDMGRREFCKNYIDKYS